MSRTRNVGLETKNPENVCKDKNCPFHGALKVRGKQFTGKIVSDKMQKSVIVEWTGLKYIPKYERYKKVRTKLKAHNPTCINAKEGDLVRIGECRPLSKTKNFVIMNVVGKLQKYALEKEAKEEGKKREKVKEEQKTLTKTEEKE
jgi:small subunit ribosomal protein S17